MYFYGRFPRRQHGCSRLATRDSSWLLSRSPSSARFARKSFPNGTIISDKPADGVLHPSFVKTLITGGKRKGQWRDPDVQTFTSGDVLYAQTGGGTSLFDKKGVFGDAFWHSFEIPAGTEIPDSLKMEGPDWNPVYKANHYQIECKAKTMRVDSMKGALDNLARNAIVRKIALASH
ncbi:MAG TPA: hypothetical protein VF453_16465 [Burkholderiaceae bacterium]